jgi:hypothetical protein
MGNAHVMVLKVKSLNANLRSQIRPLRLQQQRLVSLGPISLEVAMFHPDRCAPTGLGNGSPLVALAI